jgi:hypothetical protein
MTATPEAMGTGAATGLSSRIRPGPRVSAANCARPCAPELGEDREGPAAVYPGRMRRPVIQVGEPEARPLPPEVRGRRPLDLSHDRGAQERMARDPAHVVHC